MTDPDPTKSATADPSGGDLLNAASGGGNGEGQAGSSVPAEGAASAGDDSAAPGAGAEAAAAATGPARIEGEDTVPGLDELGVASEELDDMDPAERARQDLVQQRKSMARDLEELDQELAGEVPTRDRLEVEMEMAGEVMKHCHDRVRILRRHQQKHYATNEVQGGDAEAFRRSNEHYFATQATLRAVRADRVVALREAGLNLKELRQLLSLGASQVDVAMARKNLRGQGRPQYGARVEPAKA